MKCPVITFDNETVGEIDLKRHRVRRHAAQGHPGAHGELATGETTRRHSQGQGHQRRLRHDQEAVPAKGTGRARQGSLRSPQFRGGGIIFGPVPRSHAHDLPKKVRKLAMRCALSAKQRDGKLIVVDSVASDSAKTAALAQKLEKLGFNSVLIIGGAEVDQNFRRAAANLVGVDVLPQAGANVYDILRRDTLVLSRDAVQHLEARLK
jgi:large subunit ribosomal protein L4